MKKKQPKKTRQEINEESRLLKKKKKHKGLPSGSRTASLNKTRSELTNEPKDPRVGSKKVIPLIVDTSLTSVKQVKSKTLKVSPEVELNQLENSPYLDELMDMIEAGHKLNAKQQQDFDQMLDRIDVLMKQLGYTQDDSALNEDKEEDDDIIKEDIMSLLRR
ncbi:Der GTPase-activating protein YihI [Orbaceae bacterium ac157xtp]